MAIHINHIFEEGVIRKNKKGEVIIRCDDPLGINGQKVTKKNIKKVFKHILNIYKDAKI